METPQSTPPPPLLDQEAREAFVHNLDQNYCVAAGAGVGKTTAIVERIIQIANQPSQNGVHPLSRLVVVTYGKLAAEELKTRSRALLMTRLNQSLQKQRVLSELKSAFFGTIHSFCLRLISTFGQCLHLPETIQLLEPKEEDSLWTRFCDSEVLQNLSFDQIPAYRFVQRHFTFAQLLDLARTFDPTEVSALINSHNDVLTEPPTLNFQAALEHDGGKNPRGKETTKRHQAQLRRWITAFENQSASNQEITYVRLPEFKGGASSFLNEVESALRPYVHWVNQAASHIAALIANTWQTYRLERGLLTYRDMVFCARQLLEHPDALKQMRERKYIVILDEAQDTDADMFSLLSELTRPVEATVGEWPWNKESSGPEAGQFSFVGDEQQAIYGSRADTGIYKQYVDAFKNKNGGRYLEFSVTMRCPRSVIQSINALFVDNERLHQPDVSFRPLQPRPYCAEGSATRLILNKVPLTEADLESSSKVKKEVRLRWECDQVAQWIANQQKEGLGISTWSDLAILAPRVDWLETIAKSLRMKGLAVNIHSQKKIARDFARHSWPVALFHILMNPWDTFELIGVLREIYSISDVWLARFQNMVPKGLCFWPKMEAIPNNPHIPNIFKKNSKGKRLLSALEQLHYLRAHLPSESPLTLQTLNGYIHWVLDQIALSDRLQWIGESTHALEWFYENAKQAQCNKMTLRQWVQLQVDSLELPPPAYHGNSDTIELLTCHKSKGLEWPVVIALGVSCPMHEPIQFYPRVERDRNEKTAKVHFSKLTVDPQSSEINKERQYAEYQRLFYVTLTRAKERLIIADGSQLYEGTSGGGTNFLKLARWEELSSVESLFPEAKVSFTQSENLDLQTTENVLQQTIHRPTKSELQKAKTTAKLFPQRVLPSQLGHSREDIIHEEERMLVSSSSSSPATLSLDNPSVGGVDYGNWWHGCLEQYPWKAIQLDKEKATYYIQSELEKVDSLTYKRAFKEFTFFQENPLHQEILDNGKVFLNEVNFSYPFSTEIWIEGVIDCVVIDKQDNVWIIDWKTDRPLIDETEEQFRLRLHNKYSDQLRAYAQMFTQHLKRDLSRCFLYSTFLSSRIDIQNFKEPFVLPSVVSSETVSSLKLHSSIAA